MNKVIYGLVAVAVIAFLVSWLTGSDSVENLEQTIDSSAEVMEKKDGEAMEKTDDAMMEKAGDAMMEKKGDAMEAMEEKGDAMEAAGDSMKETGDAMMEHESAMMEEAGDAMMAKAGTYETYSAEKVAAADGAVLFFKASWCPSCRAADADITKNADQIPAGLTILEVDFDESVALKQKHGVTSQHTFVQVDASGNTVKKWVGGNTLGSIVAQVN